MATTSTARVRVVDPIDRHLGDPQPVALGEDQQLGVEEPVVVLDRGQERPGHVAAEGLEPALRVVELRVEHQSQDPVVGAGHELAPGTPNHPTSRASSREPMATSEWPRQQGSDERQEGVEVGREVDVHVGDDLGVTPVHAARRARPRPLSSRWIAATRG